jgi:hypothetical protein
MFLLTNTGRKENSMNKDCVKERVEDGRRRCWWVQCRSERRGCFQEMTESRQTIQSKSEDTAYSMFREGGFGSNFSYPLVTLSEEAERKGGQ